MSRVKEQYILNSIEWERSKLVLYEDSILGLGDTWNLNTNDDTDDDKDNKYDDEADPSHPPCWTRRHHCLFGLLQSEGVGGWGITLQWGNFLKGNAPGLCIMFNGTCYSFDVLDCLVLLFDKDTHLQTISIRYGGPPVFVQYAWCLRAAPGLPDMQREIHHTGSSSLTIKW